MMVFTIAPSKITEFIKNQSQRLVIKFKFLLNSGWLHEIFCDLKPPHLWNFQFSIALSLKRFGI